MNHLHAAAEVEAKRIFLILPSPEQLRRVVAILDRAGVPHDETRRFAKSLASQYGISAYVEPNFESYVMQPGLRLAQQEHSL